ncbi:hypothetical protein E4U91_00690 [Streptomyces lasalocidi]|uniref:Uncharacterized protein n=1 Tax=Streptomyces lasalocidi TaxID=324833 RepID=A0A4U5WAW4_STRLS|nr:hypothetical protein E4U91_00690 [Streptomyces lasalocidi]
MGAGGAGGQAGGCEAGVAGAGLAGAGPGWAGRVLVEADAWRCCCRRAAEGARGGAAGPASMGFVRRCSVRCEWFVA